MLEGPLMSDKLKPCPFCGNSIFFASMFSVIGNIYDNPELLEAQA